MVKRIRDWYIPVMLTVGVLLLSLNIYLGDKRDDYQDHCFSQQFFKLGKALEARSDAATNNNDLQRKWNLDISDPKYLSPDRPTKESIREYRTRLQHLRTVYNEEQAKIEAERASHPYPPYPKGKC